MKCRPCELKKMTANKKMPIPKRTSRNISKVFQVRGTRLNIGFAFALWMLVYLPAPVVLAVDFSTELNPTAPGESFTDFPAGAPSFTGNGTNGGAVSGGSGGNDGTRFYSFRENIGGTNYWHVIIGQEGSGFAMEFFTRASGNISAGNGYSPDSGGMERSAFGNADFCTMGGGPQAMCGSGADPLNNSNDFNYSGTGTGDGSKMAMRMEMDDGAGMSLGFYKPFTDRKALITQTVLDGDLRAEFSADMRGLNYNDLSQAAPVVNRQAVDDTTMPVPGAGDFDMSMAQDSNVTAGRFIFTAGSGWNGSGWSASNSSFGEGVYTYADGETFDVLTVPWADYFNYSDNATACNTGNRNDPTVGDPGGPDDSCPGRP